MDDTTEKQASQPEQQPRLPEEKQTEKPPPSENEPPEKPPEQKLPPPEAPDFYEQMQAEVQTALAIENYTERVAVLERMDKEYRGRDWLTPGLRAELDRLAPPESNIAANYGSRRAAVLFKENLSKLCFKNRKFYSFIQLRQVVELFCISWNVKIRLIGSAFQCFFGPQRRQRRLHDDPEKRRNREPKKKYDCPFHVSFTVERYAKAKTKRNWKPRTFHMTHICSFDLNHTCPLTEEAYQFAESSSTKESLNFKELDDVLSVLKINPETPTQDLRILLSKHVPDHFNLDSQYLSNFRHKAIRYIRANEGRQITDDETANTFKKPACELCSGVSPTDCPLTFSTNLHSKVLTLMQLTQYDRTLRKSLLSLMDTLIDRIHKGKSIEVKSWAGDIVKETAVKPDPQALQPPKSTKVKTSQPERRQKRSLPVNDSVQPEMGRLNRPKTFADLLREDPGSFSLL